MKLPRAAVAIVSLSSLSFMVRASTVKVATCADWETAVDATLTKDTTAIVTSSSFTSADCGESNVKTFEVKNNRLMVESDVASLSLVQFLDIRFEVTNNAKLTFAINAEFTLSEDEEPEVNGGFLLVENGSTARFLENLEVTGFRVMCSIDGDFCGEIFDGGCLWNEGYFRVDGYATFTDCDNETTGDASPGLGGAIFNGAKGFILFQSGVTMQDMFFNDIGDDNAAIYNAGKINIKGDSLFQAIVADNFDEAEAGAAIFNEDGAEFNFKSNAAAHFIECRGTEQGAGAVRNKGHFQFSGPATFSQCESAIYNVAPGSMRLSDGSLFSQNFEEGPFAGGAITNLAGATLELPDDIKFSGNAVVESPSCENIYFQESAGIGQTEYENEVFTCGP